MLQHRHLALPAAAILNLLPDDFKRALTTAELEWLLRRQTEMVESSPGMFRWRGSSHLPSNAPPALSLNIGAAIGKLLLERRPMDPETRRAGFKRLTALNMLCEFDRPDIARDAITEIVDRLADRVLAREGWRLSDASTLAFDGSLPAPRWRAKSESQSERRTLLAGIFALDIVSHSRYRRTLWAVRRSHAILRRELLITNLRLVASDARSYANGSFLKFSDLFQSGVEGLNRAIELYDPYLGFEFSTYATNWIRQSITRSIANEDRTIRIPVHALEVLERLESGADKLYEQSGREPQTREVAEYVGIDAKDAETLWCSAQDCLPLSEEIAESTKEPLDPFAEVERAFCRESIYEILGSELTERECYVILRRYGFGCSGSESLRDIGRELGVTGEAVRRIQKNALKKIAESERAQSLSEYWIDT